MKKDMLYWGQMTIFSDVIAIVDNGNLSVNEFLFPQYNCEDCTEVYGLYEHIFNYALKKCEENSAAGATRAAKGYPGARGNSYISGCQC